MSVEISSFHEDFRARARIAPTATAIVDARDLRSWTYGELLDLIGRCAQLMATNGATATRPVMSLLPNSPEAFVAFLATLDIV